MHILPGILADCLRIARLLFGRLPHLIQLRDLAVFVRLQVDIVRGRKHAAEAADDIGFFLRRPQPLLLALLFFRNIAAQDIYQHLLALPHIEHMLFQPLLPVAPHPILAALLPEILDLCRLAPQMRKRQHGAHSRRILRMHMRFQRALNMKAVIALSGLFPALAPVQVDPLAAPALQIDAVHYAVLRTHDGRQLHIMLRMLDLPAHPLVYVLEGED